MSTPLYNQFRKFDKYLDFSNETPMPTEAGKKLKPWEVLALIYDALVDVEEKFVPEEMFDNHEHVERMRQEIVHKR